MGSMDGLAFFLPAVLLLILLLSHPLPVDCRRKWDKMETQISLFYPGAHYILLTFNDDALPAEVTYGPIDPFHMPRHLGSLRRPLVA